MTAIFGAGMGSGWCLGGTRTTVWGGAESIAVDSSSTRTAEHECCGDLGSNAATILKLCLRVLARSTREGEHR